MSLDAFPNRKLPTDLAEEANKNSFIGGIVTLGNLGQAPNNNAKLTDGVWWWKIPDPGTYSYQNGFGPLNVTIGNGNWITPATAKELGASLGWRDDSIASVIINGAGLSNKEPQLTKSKLPTEFTLNSKFKIIDSKFIDDDDNDDSDNLWSGDATRNGTFTGALKIPVGFNSDFANGSAKVSGVLVQEESWGLTSGCGQIQIPINGGKGTYRTAAIILEQ